MKKTNWIRGAAAALLAFGAGAAWAQDYSVTATSGRWASPPASAVDVLPNFPARVDAQWTMSTPPFPVAYFGRAYSSLSISTNGFVQFGGGTSSSASYASFPQSAATDGICAPAWTHLDGTPVSAQILTWTDGTAPARRFVVSWTNFQDVSATGTLSAQVQFYEDSGRVVFAYAPTWTAATTEAVGIDAVTSGATGNDARYRTPDLSSLFTASGKPANDYQFDAPDDADEPNDTALQAVTLGPIGFVRTNRALALGNEDWYRVSVVEDGKPLVVDVAYDVVSFASTSLGLEIRATDGSVLAQGSLAQAAGPFRAVLPTAAAGDYLVRVQHLGGRALASYALQAYASLQVITPLVTTWTVGRPFETDVTVDGGVAPYSVSVADWSGLPPGLFYDAQNKRVYGTPTVAGRYEFILTCSDSGAPANAASLLQTIVVNPAVDVRLGEFTAFALGKSAARSIPAVGGTPPFTCGTTSGALPVGVSCDASSLQFVGTANSVGSSTFSYSVTDAAGATASESSTAVVCSPAGTFGLDAGASAAGVYFDAPEGAIVKLSVATTAKAAKRALHATLLLPDGTTPVAAKTTLRPGRADVTHFVAPVSGRYYFVVSSDAGPATSLVGKATVSVPVRGAGSAADFGNGDHLTVEIGAIAGSSLSFTGKWGGAGPSLFVQSLIDPTGVATPVAPADMKFTANSVTLAKTLALGGTWKVVLTGAQTGPGKITYSYKLTAPHGATYSADQ